MSDARLIRGNGFNVVWHLQDNVLKGIVDGDDEYAKRYVCEVGPYRRKDGTQAYVGRVWLRTFPNDVERMRAYENIEDSVSSVMSHLELNAHSDREAHENEIASQAALQDWIDSGE